MQNFPYSFQYNVGRLAYISQFFIFSHRIRILLKIIAVNKRRTIDKTSNHKIVHAIICDKKISSYPNGNYIWNILYVHKIDWNRVYADTGTNKWGLQYFFFYSARVREWLCFTSIIEISNILWNESLQLYIHKPMQIFQVDFD